MTDGTKSLKTAIFHLSQTKNITCAQGCVLGQHFQGTLRTRPVVLKAKVPRSRGQGLEASHWSSRPRCQGLEAKVKASDLCDERQSSMGCTKGVESQVNGSENHVYHCVNGCVKLGTACNFMQNCEV